MSEELYISVSPGETRAALTRDGRLIDFMAEVTLGTRPFGLPGTVVLGRIRKMAPELGGAFVDIGSGEDAFLPLRRRKANLHEGKALIVQVTRAPMAAGDKGARVSDRPVLPGRFVALTPGGKGVVLSHRLEREKTGKRLLETVAPVARGGITLRRAALGAPEALIADEIRMLSDAWRGIEESAAEIKAPAPLYRPPEVALRALRDFVTDAPTRIAVDDAATFRRMKAYAEKISGGAMEIEHHTGAAPLFDEHDIEAQIEELATPLAALPGGGSFVFGETEALTAIDVNAGGSGLAGGQAAADTALQTNLTAAGEIARHLRLRHIGGAVLIDFIRMETKSARNKVLKALERAVEDDPEPCDVLGFTRGGLMEMTRRRSGDAGPALSEPCGACGGTGRIRSAEAVALRLLRAIVREARANPGRALSVAAAPAVIDWLSRRSDDVAHALSASGAARVSWRTQAALSRERFEIRAIAPGTDKKEAAT